MRRPWWFPVLLGALIVAAPGLAVSDADDLDRNRRLLERWKADPEHHDRLQRDLRAFHELPAGRQDAMRRLDQQLHQDDSSAQARLWTALVRYHDWVERLPPADRAALLAAPPRERLARIRASREREWIEKLPARLRDEMTRLRGEPRAARLRELRAEERALRRTWLAGPGPALASGPKRLTEMPDAVQQFVENQLKPQLSAEEKKRLREAEGRWPDLPREILLLAERHPVLPPLPSPRRTILRFDDLPGVVKAKIRRSLVERFEGRWPDFALAVVQAFRAARQQMPAPLGASRPADFPPLTRAFLTDKLPGLVEPAQLAELKKLEGVWPEYPRLLLQLARDHRFVIPGLTLPGPHELWDSARAQLPDVPDRTLHQFAMKELTAEDRRRMGISLSDPHGSRERIKWAWFNKMYGGKMPAGKMPGGRGHPYGKRR
jgi:hypothetical protein